MLQAVQNISGTLAGSSDLTGKIGDRWTIFVFILPSPDHIQGIYLYAANARQDRFILIHNRVNLAELPENTFGGYVAGPLDKNGRNERAIPSPVHE